MGFLGWRSGSSTTESNWFSISSKFLPWNSSVSWQILGSSSLIRLAPVNLLGPELLPKCKDGTKHIEKLMNDPPSKKVKSHLHTTKMHNGIYAAKSRFCILFLVRETEIGQKHPKKTTAFYGIILEIILKKTSRPNMFVEKIFPPTKKNCSLSLGQKTPAFLKKKTSLKLPYVLKIDPFEKRGDSYWKPWFLTAIC